jgi:hypothetical protein
VHQPQFPNETPPVIPVDAMPPVVRLAVNENHLSDFVTGNETETRRRKRKAKKKRIGFKNRIIVVSCLSFHAVKVVRKRREERSKLGPGPLNVQLEILKGRRTDVMGPELAVSWSSGKKAVEMPLK